MVKDHENLHLRHDRDDDEQKGLQLRRGICRCTHGRVNDLVQARGLRHRGRTVLLSQTGHDAELHGPADEEESKARSAMSPAITALYMPLPKKGITINLDHTGHDAEHHGPANQREHSARYITTNKPAKHMPLPVSTARQQLPHQSLRNLTHEHESTVEPSIALKYESPSARRKCELLQKLRELTQERESTVKPRIAQNTKHFPEIISQKNPTVSLRTVLLVQTDQDVEHLEHFHHRREHSE